MCLGIPALVISITDPSTNLGVVDVSGVKRQVNFTCVVDDKTPIDSLVGKWVLLHVGFAMSIIDEAEAQNTLSLLRSLGEVEPELAAMQASGGA